MASVLSRYLLRFYFRVALSCLTGLIFILLLSRFEFIARFAVLGSGPKEILLFTLLQIPYILPFIIPISCLIAAFLLFNRLSHSHEITAARAAGRSIYHLAAPILASSLILGLLTFAISSELTPYSRRKANELSEAIARINPLLLLQKDSGLGLKELYADVKKLEKGKSAEEIILVMRPKGTGKFSIISADKLLLEDGLLQGTNVAFISSFGKDYPNGFDNLLIENQKKLRCGNSLIADLGRQGNSPKQSQKAVYQSSKLLIGKLLSSQLTSSGPLQMELLRRISMSLATFTLTFIGLSCGLTLGRTPSKRGLLMASSLATFFLLAFISGKALVNSPYLLLLCYLAPHPIIWFFSFFRVRKMEQGALS